MNMCVGVCVNIGYLLVWKPHNTSQSLVQWNFHSSNCVYHSFSIRVLFLSHCLFTVIQTKVSLLLSEILMSGQVLNLAAAPFSWKTYAKSFTIHPPKHRRHRSCYLERSILSCLVEYLARMSNVVCIHFKEGWPVPLCTLWTLLCFLLCGWSAEVEIISSVRPIIVKNFIIR